MKNLSLILFLFFSFHLNSQNVFVVKQAILGEKFEIHQLSLASDTSLILQFKFESNNGCSDVAIAPNGTFYGIGDNKIYEINPSDETTTTLKDIPLSGFATSLVCDNNNNLYSLKTNGMLHKYNILNNTLEEIFQFQSGTPGDLTFYKGNLIFQASWDGNLKAFNLDNQSLVTIRCMENPINNLQQNIFGLSNNSDDCESLSIIAATSANDLYEMDIANGTIKYLELSNPFLYLKTPFLGLASSNEHLSSTCSFQFTNVDCTTPDDSDFFILGKTPIENVYHIYSLNPDQSLTFQYEFYSEFGCSDIAYTLNGFLYGIGTDSPATLFKINPIAGKAQKLISYPSNKIIETIVSNTNTSIYAIDQNGLVHVYDIFCNQLSFLTSMGHAPTNNLALQNDYLLFQSKMDGNIKAFDIINSALLNILCLEPPYNNTLTGGFIGLSNNFPDCELNKLTVFTNQNIRFELDLDTDIISQIPLNINDLGDNVTIQGTAYDNSCSAVSSNIYTDVICSSAVENIAGKFKINIFPNPVNDIFTIVSDTKIERIKIYDTLGRVWKNIKLTSNNINVEDLSQGVYFLEIHTEFGKVVRKIIKE